MRLYWIETPCGRLATAPAPSGSSLGREIVDLLEAEVDIVVSLLASEEAASIGLADEAAVMNEAGISFQSIPTPDFGVLDDYRQAQAVVSELVQHLNAGQTAVVHCRGGIGRSSTIAAVALTQLGLEPNEAMDRITKARGLRVPETRAQRLWVHGYAEWCGEVTR
ncbi:MAG: tyrosine protein phosphatase [Acidimicrobiaceae bacterium]|nr:tyrosine protein phosphatase [Acidimicrobiaceae bacterium]|tara:strand:+ start:4164 stop:4658 length:495 start_codon:yes stop_codon:yes gene_type:complete